MANIKAGDKVTCSAEYDWNGTHLASFVRKTTFNVIRVGGQNMSNDRIVIGTGNQVIAAVHSKYLTVLGKPATTPKTDVKSNVTKTLETVDLVVNQVLDGIKKQLPVQNKKSTINGSKVQHMNKKYNANDISDYGYKINNTIENRKNNNMHSAENRALDRQEPSKVQNLSNFPKVKRFDASAGYYRYDYYMDYDSDKLSNGSVVSSDMAALRKSLNLDVMNRKTLFLNYTKKYDKFKLGNPNDRLAKTFAHVFFVRPDCNIYAEGSNGKQTNPTLVRALENMPDFYYAKKHSPELLRQLTQSGANYDNEFMMLLSNKARSFQIADEYIKTDSYGQGLTGYKIPYGKDNVESRTVGTFSINYTDDRDLHIYHLHKLWIDYISYVFRGKAVPKDQYIKNKILDYPTCVYYFLCAEDGETIIFWSKYWGVFPIEAPSSKYSFSQENPGGTRDPELEIQYQFAWKEDFNPLSIVEFNMHSNTKFSYVNNYQSDKLGTGYTWSGAPFIETFNSANDGINYEFKLRFRPEST